MLNVRRGTTSKFRKFKVKSTTFITRLQLYVTRTQLVEKDIRQSCDVKHIGEIQMSNDQTLLNGILS